MRVTPEEMEWIKSTPHKTTGRHVLESREILGNNIAKQWQHIREGRGKTDSRRSPSISEMIGNSREQGTLTECGRFIEIWVSAEKHHTGLASGGACAVRGRTKEEQQESQESIAARVNHRARKRIRRIVNANDFRAMHTLTLAPPSPENNAKYLTIPYEQQRDYDYVRRLLKAFFRRCRRADVPITYLAVFELHDSERTNPEKRGAWHIHLATNTDEQVKWAIEDLWWYGRTDYQDYRYDKGGGERDEAVSNPGAYIAEYIGKGGAQFGAKELINKRRYTTSRDIVKPIQQTLSSVNIGGNFDVIEYRGERYKNVFYDSKEVPGTNKLSITATYQKEEV